MPKAMPAYCACPYFTLDKVRVMILSNILDTDWQMKLWKVSGYSEYTGFNCWGSTLRYDIILRVLVLMEGKSGAQVA